MPDYREVGKTLMALIRSYALEDDPPSNVTFTADASENNFFRPPSLPQRDIGECPRTDSAVFIHSLLGHYV